MRRSQDSEESLPLGLHVLGLPLAFILSQDQTLHCMLCLSYLKGINDLVFFPYLVVYYFSMISSLSLFFKVKSFCRSFTLFAWAKVITNYYLDLSNFKVTYYSFHYPKSFLFSKSKTSALPVLPDCKDTNFFLTYQNVF